MYFAIDGVESRKGEQTLDIQYRRIMLKWSFSLYFSFACLLAFDLHNFLMFGNSCPFFQRVFVIHNRLP